MRDSLLIPLSVEHTVSCGCVDWDVSPASQEALRYQRPFPRNGAPLQMS